MYNLYSVFSECKQDLVNINIPIAANITIEPNYRAHKRYGQCRRHPNGTYSININVDLLKEANPISALKSTVYHELLHTCPDCMNHGKQWKAYADKVNRMYHTIVKRCSTQEERGIVEFRKPEKRNKYTVTCLSCGHQWNYQRAGNVVQHPCNFKCGCGGKLTVTTNY